MKGKTTLPKKEEQQNREDQGGTKMAGQEQIYAELRDINKSFGDFRASDHVSFTVEKGKLIGLLGPSGSGKTTILRILAGLETADSGEIYIDGKKVNDIPASKRGVGFVFQSYALFRYKTVYENIAFGLRVNKWNKTDIKNRVEELIELVGLKGMEKRYPNQLSGGQRQRVAFARALATQPQLLLLDEPFAAIDAKVRKELRSWLRELINAVGITSIFVTHDQDEAIEVADEIIVTNRGRIEQIGSPLEIYRNPSSAFVAQFIGEPTVIENVSEFKGFTSVQSGLKAVIRPEYVSVTKKTEHLKYPVTAEEGTIERTSFRGNDIEVKIKVRGRTLTANRGLGEAPLEEGERVNVFVACMYILDGEKAYTVQNDALMNQDSIYNL
jgi:sulfate transport system ATP-binding protein